MITSHRIWAYLLRHLYQIRESIDRKADIVLYPTIDILIFGLLSVYVQKLEIGNNLASAVLGAIILWTLVYNIQRDVSFSLLEDAWSRNLFNLFATPLKIAEVIIGILIISLLKALLTIALLLVIAYGLFHFNLFAVGGVLAFYILNMFVFGWAFGFFATSIILRFGTKVQAAAWSLLLLIYPISGVFYPLSILPPFLAKLAYFLPISHVFEGLRGILISHAFPSANDLIIIAVLNLIYLIIGICLFVFGFRNAKERGWFIHPN